MRLLLLVLFLCFFNLQLEADCGAAVVARPCWQPSHAAPQASSARSLTAACCACCTCDACFSSSTRDLIKLAAGLFHLHRPRLWALSNCSFRLVYLRLPLAIMPAAASAPDRRRCHPRPEPMPVGGHDRLTGRQIAAQPLSRIEASQPPGSACSQAHHAEQDPLRAQPACPATSAGRLHLCYPPQRRLTAAPQRSGSPRTSTSDSRLRRQRLAQHLLNRSPPSQPLLLTRHTRCHRSAATPFQSSRSTKRAPDHRRPPPGAQ